MPAGCGSCALPPPRLAPRPTLGAHAEPLPPKVTATPGQAFLLDGIVQQLHRTSCCPCRCLGCRCGCRRHAPPWARRAQRHTAFPGCAARCVPPAVLSTAAPSRAPLPHGGCGRVTALQQTTGAPLPALGWCQLSTRSECPPVSQECRPRGFATDCAKVCLLSNSRQAVFANIHRHLMAEGTVDPRQVLRRLLHSWQALNLRTHMAHCLPCPHLACVNRHLATILAHPLSCILWQAWLQVLSTPLSPASHAGAYGSHPALQGAALPGPHPGVRGCLLQRHIRCVSRSHPNSLTESARSAGASCLLTGAPLPPRRACPLPGPQTTSACGASALER